MTSSAGTTQSDVHLEDWFEERGVTPYNRFERSCLHDLAGLSRVGPYRLCQGTDCWINDSKFDHRRRFRVRSRNRIVDYAGVIAAPYRPADRIEPYVKELCEKFGLAHRIGDPRDDYYGHGTTPFVIWNPDRISL